MTDLTSRVDALEAALKVYKDTFCEGFCEDFPDAYYTPDMRVDCSGCLARAVLAGADIAAITEVTK